METTRNISDYGGSGLPFNSVRGGEERMPSLFDGPKERAAPKLFFSWKPLTPAKPKPAPKPRFSGAPEVIFPFKVYEEPETDDTHAETENSQGQSQDQDNVRQETEILPPISQSSSGGATAVVKYSHFGEDTRTGQSSFEQTTNN